MDLEPLIKAPITEQEAAMILELVDEEERAEIYILLSEAIADTRVKVS